MEHKFFETVLNVGKSLQAVMEAGREEVQQGNEGVC